MLFTPAPIEGAFVVDLQRVEDERGFFATSWSRQEFAERGLETDLALCNVSFNAASGTLRGLHYQLHPHQEVKLVRCTAGAIFDVLVDLRRGSPTFKQWFGLELTADNRRTLYVPAGCAHGYLTLEDACEVFYQVSAAYAPASARGVRWNDPAFGVAWPAEPRVMLARDRDYPDFAGSR
jgi:dTDP-4-dehydrorhamnose 3,5-epimerase